MNNVCQMHCLKPMDKKRNIRPISTFTYYDRKDETIKNENLSLCKSIDKNTRPHNYY